jgi:MSHA biogenesis protein MshM
MYEAFFKLRQAPFESAHNPHFHVELGNHAAARMALIQAVERRDTIIWVCGAPGAGKTMLLRTYQNSIDKRRVWSLFCTDAELDRAGLTAALGEALAAPGEPPPALPAIPDLLKAKAGQGVIPVLIIDDADLIDLEAWETLTGLAELKVATLVLGSRLVDQPDGAPAGTRVKLDPLSADDASALIEERLRRAGGTPEKIINREALDRIVERGAGNPRRLLSFADSALRHGYAAGVRPVTVQELDAPKPGHKPKPVAGRRWFPTAAGVGIGIVLLVLVAIPTGLLTSMHRAAPETAPAPVASSQAPPPPKLALPPPAPQAPPLPAPASPPVAAAPGPPPKYTLPPPLDTADVLAIPARRGDTLRKLYAALFPSDPRPDFAAVAGINPDIRPSTPLKAGQVVLFPPAPGRAQ